VENEARDLNRSGDFPAEVEVPAFGDQIALFQQHKTCSEVSPAGVTMPSKVTPSSLSDLVDFGNVK
jgi:hypothetical protein